MARDRDPVQPSRDLLRRRFMEQAASLFDLLFPAGTAAPAVAADQRDALVRTIGQQLVGVLADRQQDTSEHGFLGAILASPADDAPRLVFADWLEENGQPARADFIRIQCRLADRDPEDVDTRLLEARERELLREHREAWADHIPARFRKLVEFERGFPGILRIPALSYVRDGRRLRELAPIDHLILTDFEATAPDLLASGLLRGLRHLNLYRGANAGRDVEAILASPQLAGLTHLSLDACAFSHAAAEALSSNPHLDRLGHLAMRFCDLDPARAAVLSRSPLLDNLRSLDLYGNQELGAEGLAQLVRSPRWGGLRRLDLRECGIKADAVRELATVPVARSLESLSLVGAYPAEAVAVLANAAPLDSLRHLNLGICGLGDGGLETLGRATGLPRLESLDLLNNNISADGVAAFVRGSLLGRLKRLSLSCNHIGPDGLRALVHSPQCAGLRELELAFCRINREAGEILAGSPHLTRLEWLSLYGENLGPHGARALAGGNFPSLAYLSLNTCNVGSEGATAIVDSPLGQTLRWLVLKSSGVKLAVRPQLQARIRGHILY